MRRTRANTNEVTNNDRWLVSYSDFITLLFAFFVVLFASTHHDNRSIVRVSQSIHTGFQTLGAFPGEHSQAALSDRHLHADTALPPSTAGAAAPHPSPADLEALRRQLQAAIGPELKSHEVELGSTSEGFVVSLKELGFFNSGQAELLPGAAQKIKRIACILAQHHLDVRIEGHSDDQPIHTAQFRSNWELSTARAMTVLSLLVNDAGYDPAILSVAGYGQYRPLADNGTAEGRRMNRRVDLVGQERVSP
jgi:chemotaxis protein MotB